MLTQLTSLLTLRDRRPPILAGLSVAAAGVAIETLAIYPLGRLAPAATLGVVYVVAVVIAAIYWGTALGLLTALVSAIAFNFFHLPPVGRFTPGDGRTWIA